MSFENRLIFVLMLFSSGLFPQSFDIEQATQLLRPRIKTEGRFILPAELKDTTGHFSLNGQAVNITFPIKRKFSVDIALSLKSLKLKDIIKNSVRLKAYDILGSIRFTLRQVRMSFDSLPNKNIYGINAGITGLHLTRKYKIAFYTLNAHLHEQDRYLHSPGFRLSALAGQYHLRGIRKSFYYGAALIYSDGLLLPAPFIGGTEKLFKNWYFNYTLPVQMNLEYNHNKHRMITGIKADGFRSSLLFRQIRHSVNYKQGIAYLNYRYRFSNTFYAFAEGGYIFYHQLHISNTSDFSGNYNIKNSTYIQAGFFAYLGKGLLEKIIEQLF